MRRIVLRYSGLIGLILLLALLLVSGCTRAKSSGPEEATADQSGTAAVTPTTGGQVEPTTELSGQEAIDATTTAWAQETATAEAPTSAATNTPAPTTATEEEATATPAPTVPAEATAVPEATAEPEATTAPAPTEPPTAGGEKIHVVQPGENLFRISLSYGLSYDEVAAYNGITNPSQIYVGQAIKIPAAGSQGPSAPQPPPTSGGKTHVVKSGENLFRVALQYNMLYTELAAANNLSYPYTIYTGQVLIIP